MVDGDTDMGSVMAGQISAMVQRVEPARDIISNVVTDAENIIRHICGKVVL